MNAKLVLRASGFYLVQPILRNRNCNGLTIVCASSYPLSHVEGLQCGNDGTLGSLHYVQVHPEICFRSVAYCMHVEIRKTYGWFGKLITNIYQTR